MKFFMEKNEKQSKFHLILNPLESNFNEMSKSIMRSDIYFFGNAISSLAKNAVVF